MKAVQWLAPAEDPIHRPRRESHESYDRFLQPIDLQRYIIELRQSLRFGLSDEERADINLTITGPGASLPGLAELLARELDVLVEKDKSRVAFDATAPGHDGGEVADVLHHRSFLNQLALVPRQMRVARTSLS